MNNQNSNLSYELEVQQMWEDKNIYSKVKEQKQGREVFSWVEGPPYPTGEAHLGHLRNWAIKDSVFRFKRFQGYDVYTKDGYDVHGLPIEQKVQKELGIEDTKQLLKFGEEKFVDKCREYVDRIINDMKGLRARYGLSIAKEHYQTSHPQYISMAWRFFKKAQEKNLLYKDYRCVAWSPGLETTLSDYEVKDSYAMLNDPSIYVRIKLKDEHTTTKFSEYVVIWTTTPWTLEANLAVGVHKDFEYSKVKVHFEDGEECVLIVATALVENCMNIFSKSRPISNYEEIEVVKGEQLVGCRYEPIYSQNVTQKRLHKDDSYHRIVHADFVSLGGNEDAYLEKLERKKFKHDHTQDVATSQAEVEEHEKEVEAVQQEEQILKEKSSKKKIADGTGLVHEAPAHGMEDFELCRNLGITEAYCIVGSKGEMIKESKWAGIFFKDADAKIIEYLMSTKQMLHYEYKEHKYPLCWRSKVPIVYRTTEQWYIKRSELIEDMISSNSKDVEWFPKTAKGAFNNLLSNAGDWAISRQRFWGTPLPIFEHKDSGEYIVVGSKEELEELTQTQLDDVHKTDLQPLVIKKDGKEFRFVNYTCDVWFDSGCASFASHYNEGLSFDEIIEKYYPLSWITEGEDQMRGWFSSLMNVGYLTTGKVPYNQVLFYRFVMDKDGVKMSKSIGNGISGNEAIDTWGADRTRYYLLYKTAPEEQLNFNPEEFSIVDGVFNTIDNVFKFTNSYLEEHQQHLEEDSLVDNIEDEWILKILEQTQQKIISLMNEYRFDQAIRVLEEFIVEEYSKTYLKLVKERCEGVDTSLMKVFAIVNKAVCINLAMFSPFKAEELYQKSILLFKYESVLLEEFNEVFSDAQDSIVENFSVAQDVVQAILSSREKAKIGVRWPLKDVRIISSNVELKEQLTPFEELIKQLTNIDEISYDSQGIEMSYVIKPNFASLKDKFGQDMGRVIGIINKEKDELSKSVQEGNLSITISGIEIDLTTDILVETIISSQDVISSKFSLGDVIVNTHQDEELLKRGYVREIIRRIQDLRKESGYEKKDVVCVSFEGSSEYYLNLFNDFRDIIMQKVGANDLIINRVLKYSKEDEIKEQKLVVSIEKKES
ncbi:MAG: isoleucine--tRNA ligase [Nanoarchaeota archaeon]|nr:isoleucine--tRNA ligase [Nanoarchaeota archaeon]